MSKRHFLDFEQPIAELEAKIEELRYVQNESAVDISDEIDRLDKKSQQLTKDIYSQPDALAGDADRAPPAAPLHARLRGRAVHRLRRNCTATGRYRRRPVDRRRAGAIQRPGLHGASATRRAATPRSARRATSAWPARGLPQGAAADAAWPRSSACRCSPSSTRPGAYPGIGAEERGQCEAIGRNIFEMAQLEVPIIVTIIGEGGSGGALALSALATSC